MAEPKRLDPVTPAEAADRDSRAEALLVDGLDRYFAGRYEDAIHLWTRVLFLDRSHARARAYIDRARTALAERQRRAEELLHESEELLDKGETSQARHLLTAAVAATGEDERAADLRARLERLERVHAAGRTEAALARRGVSVAPWPRVAMPSAAIWLVAAAGAMLWIGVRSPAVRERLGLLAPQQELLATAPEVSTPVLSSAEIAMVRARTLYARGRLAEALEVLDRVDPDSTVRGAADALRIDIEHLLLTGARDRTRAETPRETGRQ
jgi:tetratricopeptide (TPR) repeat protein